MKPTTAILLIILLMSTICSGQNVWKDEFMQRDKLDHAVMSTWMTIGTTEMCRNLKLKHYEMWGQVATNSAGLAKEAFMDERFSWPDAVTNLAFSFVGRAAWKWIHNDFKFKKKLKHAKVIVK